MSVGPAPPAVYEVFLSIWDNPYLTDQAKREFEASLDEDERKLRIDGDFAITGTRVFEANFFPRGIHGIDPFPIPANWCRFASIDPGFQVGAVLFAAIPPMKPDKSTDLDDSYFGDFIYLYDQIYIRGCDAVQIARAFRQHVGDQEMYVHLLDHHGGKLREIGSGRTPEQQYREHFKKEKIKLPTVGTMFTYGSDDVAGRILRIKEWLRVRQDGTTKLRFIKSAVPSLCSEMERYTWKVRDGVVTDEPVKKGDHLCLAAGTMIETDVGLVPIERIRPGDSVLTSQGYRRVLAAGMTCEAAEVMTVRFSDGRTLTGTKDHPVFLQDGRSVALDDLGYGDIVASLPYRSSRGNQKWVVTPQRLSSTRGSSSVVTRNLRIGQTAFITRLAAVTRRGGSGDYTRKSGRICMGRSPRDATSITRTTIPPITTLEISNALRFRNIERITQRLFRMKPRKGGGETSKRFGRWPLLGIQLKKGSSCIPRMAGRDGRTACPPRSPAHTVGRPTNQRIFVAGISIARGIVRPTPGGSQGSTTSPLSALDAASLSSRTSIPCSGTAPVSVVSMTVEPERRAVFNLTVEGVHEYYANGVLVCNCDNLGYLVMYPQLRYHKPKVLTAKEADGSYASYKAMLALEKRLKRRSGRESTGVTLA